MSTVIITEGNLPRPRMLRQFHAWALGYFWLPCPICGEKFAGFEDGDVSVRIPGSASRRVACKRHRYGSFE